MAAPTFVAAGAKTEKPNDVGSTSTVAPPAGHASGDLLVIHAVCFQTVTMSTPGGWTLLGDSGNYGPGLRNYLFWKLAASSSEPSVTLTTSAGAYDDSQMYAFRGVDQVTPIDAATVFGAVSSTGTAAVPAITTVTNESLMVVVGSDSSSHVWGVPPAGATERVHATTSNLVSFCLSTETKTPAGTEAADVYGSTSGNPTRCAVFALRSANPAGAASTFVPQIIWFTPAPLTTAPAAPTFESATAYSTVANRPAVTGTTRPFASSAALTGALNAAAPGDLVQYTGAGILDIPGNFTGFTARRYTGYVNVDLGLKSSPNHVRFTGGTAGYPSVYIYNSQFLRIYGGEITNATGGTEGLQVNGAGVPGNGSTNHIVWWNFVVHDCRSDGIGMFPTLALSGSNPTSADLTIADCDIQAEVYNVCLDKTIDVEAELGTGQHCAILADTDPIGATYPSFLRNRVAIDGHDTGLTANQGGGSVIEIGFVDPASTISGCTLIMRGNHMMFNGQRMSGGNCLSVWGDATINAQVPFLQHSNSTGSGVYNNDGVNRSSVVVAYGRHQNTNQNFGLEGTNPWQIGPTYRDVD